MASVSLLFPPRTPLPRAVKHRLWWASAGSLLLPWLAGVWFKFGLQPGLHNDYERAALTVDIVVIATIVFLLTMVFTVAIGCWVVAVMKGPVHTADAYPESEPR